ncbi:MAG: MBL fold metallo-hydrolase [Candidatus Hermodarchaeota archaeon]
MKTSDVRLTFLGGVSEVGGNKILLEDFNYGVKIFLDFGINIKEFNDNFDKYDEPCSVMELIRLGLLPRTENIPIENLYTDYEANKDKEYQDLATNLDGILISHPHKDHFYGLSFTNRNIPIYAGVFTKKIISAYYKSSKRSICNNYDKIDWNLFRTGDILDIKGLKIVPVHVDHSIPAAYGFIIKTSRGIVVYSGDFRMHGPLSNMTQDFLKEIKVSLQALDQEETVDKKLRSYKESKVKILLCEGTNINKGTIESEDYVEQNLELLFAENPFDFLLVKYDRLDWDRFRTFSLVAKKYDWKFIISEKDAYFYYLMNKDEIYETMNNPNIINDDHILILSHGNVKYKWQEKIRQKMYRENKGHRFLKDSDIKDLKKQFFFYITSLRKNIIEKINPELKGAFISSSIDPYTEEYIDNNRTLTKYFRQHGIPSYRVHASGHAMPHHLINFINSIDPEFLIPIHTKHPQFFKTFFKTSEINVIIPVKNEKIDFN